MFRPAPPPSRVGYAPVRLAVGVFLLVVLLLALAVVVGMQWERHRVLETGANVPPDVGLGLPSSAAAKLFLAVLTLAALGIVVFMTRLNYRAITQTFERVKSLMRNILESIPTGVLTLDRLGVVTSLNGAAERLLGLRATAVVGHRLGELDAAPDLVQWIEAAREGTRLVHETDLVLELEGSRRLTVRGAASELRDDTGHADGLVILLRDVSEINRLETQLRRADKLSALGTLSAGVAHEVKNPLHALTLNLHLLEKEISAGRGASPDAQEYLAVLRSEIQRIHRIVENFLRFSKPAIPEVKPLDVNALLERVLSLIAFEAAEHLVTIETAFEASLPSVFGDEGQLSQVFLNLTMNALQAMPNGGVLGVFTRLDGGWVEIAVKDTGDGIQAEALPHVFDPYYTTRPRGVGLGLAIAHRIVEGHRGTIDVETDVGKGTMMTVRLLREPSS
jgi:PAS domain S-box-containing protein